MQNHSSHSEKPTLRGGLAQYCVEHREVAWMALAAVLLWGAFAYRSLPQQEDAKIPSRTALVVTHFSGAGALKLEDLVTKKLEEKIDELESIEEITSQSRPGVSFITVKQRPDKEAIVQQEWDKLRAKLREVTLPEGCGTPNLDTDFGNTLTLLFALTSPQASEAETVARANLVRTHLADLRAKTGSQGRVAALAFYPPTVAESYCAAIRQKFETALALEKLGDDIKTIQTKSFMLVDFKTCAKRMDIQRFVHSFTRSLVGSENEPHPDGGPPIILMGDEDPLPALRAAAMPRYTYRELEKAADLLEDEIKQIGSVGRVRKIGNVSEEVDLLFSVPVMNGFKFTGDEVMNAISARNAIIPGGTFRAEGQNFPVQLSGEFKNEDELLGAIVSITRDGSPIYLRDVFEVRRGYENPIPYNVEVIHRGASNGPLTQARSVLLAIEMKEGNKISEFNETVRGVLNAAKSRLPEGVKIITLSDQPASVAQRIHHFMRCFIEAVIVVVLVALFLMDWRSALVVAAAIPLTVAMTFGGMALVGIPLHQISIAALIIALGMLVDDPVVASDAINREMAHGQPRGVAAWFGPYRLRHAILFGTIINIVAFLAVESPIQVRLVGDNLDVLRAKADEIAKAVREAGGYKVHDDLGRRMPVVQIDIDQERANTLGIQNSQVGRIAQASFSGVKVTELREGDHLVPVKVRLRIEERNEADKIRTLYVRSMRDQLVPLDSFANVNLKPEYATIAHFNKMRSVTVKSFSPFGELPSTVLARARAAIKHVQLPPGFRLEYAGEDKELKKSKEEIGRVLLISLALITLAMVIQFNSVIKSLVVMLTVPLGLIGAFTGIVAMQTSLGFMAFIGIMSLAGVVVSHIIVLSDFIEEARAEGMELKEALVQAGLVRLRAVLVTVLATVGGLIPLALTGGELWRPLTAVHIFGLLFATSLTLIALPVLYYIFCAKLRWIK